MTPYTMIRAEKHPRPSIKLWRKGLSIGDWMRRMQNPMAVWCLFINLEGKITTNDNLPRKL
jgi:hypothetical protein